MTKRGAVEVDYSLSIQKALNCFEMPHNHEKAFQRRTGEEADSVHQDDDDDLLENEDEGNQEIVDDSKSAQRSVHSGYILEESTSDVRHELDCLHQGECTCITELNVLFPFHLF